MEWLGVWNCIFRALNFKFQSLKFGENRSFSLEFQAFSGKFRPLKKICRTLENGHSIRHHSIPPLSAGRNFPPREMLPQMMFRVARMKIPRLNMSLKSSHVGMLETTNCIPHPQKASNLNMVFSRGWCTNGQNLREQQNIHHPQHFNCDVQHGFTGVVRGLWGSRDAVDLGNCPKSESSPKNG